MDIVQKLWRRLQYVRKNEAVYNFTYSESSGGCGVSYLEPSQKKRKELKYMDESRNDAVMSGCRTDLCVCSILDQPAFYADVDRKSVV